MSKLEVTVFLNLFYKGRRKIRMLIERRKEGRYDFYDRFKEGAPFSDTRSQTGGRKRWVRSKRIKFVPRVTYMSRGVFSEER